jgi:hypothetical protein
MSATCPQFTMSVDRPDMSDELEAARCLVTLVTSPETPQGIHTPPTLKVDVVATLSLLMLTVVDANPYTAASATVEKVSVIADADMVDSVNVSGDSAGLVLFVKLNVDIAEMPRDTGPGIAADVISDVR